jgi:EKC/KEOPS complex subunit CGI121/TPRKB
MSSNNQILLESSLAMGEVEIVSLPHLEDTPVYAALFTNVQNAGFLRQQLLDGNTDFEYAFIDATAVGH